MRIQQVAMAAAVAVTLAGCGGNSTPPAASSSSSSTATSATTTAAASSGDVAACKGYLRVQPAANRDLADMAKNPTPPFLISSTFKRWATDLESGTGAATDPSLVDAIKGTVAGLRSAAATADANQGDALDLRPDMQVVFDNSLKVSDFCSIADPAARYSAIYHEASS